MDSPIYLISKDDFKKDFISLIYGASFCEIQNIIKTKIGTIAKNRIDNIP